MKTLAITAMLASLLAISTCTKDDGEPDPPVRGLVPCHPDAGSDDPLACPPPVDAGVDAAQAAPAVPS